MSMSLNCSYRTFNDQPRMTQKSQAILFVLLTTLYFSCHPSEKHSLIYDKLNVCDAGDLDSTILCGAFAVFENRQTRVGRKINLNIIVIPALHKDLSKAPIFCFEGGPGVAVSSGAAFYSDSVNYYRLDHDIVLIDVRGTGASNPLHCRQLQLKAGLAQQFEEMYPEQDVKDCYDSLSQLADLRQYTTTNMAIDIEEVRKWLGYKKINIFGLSFGGRLAQVYMKLFPTSVENCVLWSPTTTSSRMPLYHATYAQASLNKVFEDCGADSSCHQAFPNLKSEFQTLMDRGKSRPFGYLVQSQAGQKTEVKIPWYAFHTKIRSLMYSPSGLREIPFIVHESYLNNWHPFISLFPADESYNKFIAEGLYLCVTCSEDVPFITKKESDSLSSGTFMGEYRVQQQMEACSHWTKGDIQEDFFEPVKSSIPTLVFSGDYDPVTPPSMAAQIVKTLSKGYLISIPTMSHTFDGLSNPECFDKMVVDFFNRPFEKPNTECIATMLPVGFKTAE